MSNPKHQNVTNHEQLLSVNQALADKLKAIKEREARLAARVSGKAKMRRAVEKAAALSRRQRAEAEHTKKDTGTGGSDGGGPEEEAQTTATADGPETASDAAPQDAAEAHPATGFGEKWDNSDNGSVGSTDPDLEGLAAAVAAGAALAVDAVVVTTGGDGGDRSASEAAGAGPQADMDMDDESEELLARLLKASEGVSPTPLSPLPHEGKYSPGGSNYDHRVDGAAVAAVEVAPPPQLGSSPMGRM